MKQNSLQDRLADIEKSILEMYERMEEINKQKDEMNRTYLETLKTTKKLKEMAEVRSNDKQ